MIININDISLQTTNKRKYVKFYPGALLSIGFVNNDLKIDIRSNKDISIIGNIKKLAYELVSHIVKNNYIITSGSIMNSIFNINPNTINYNNVLHIIIDMFFPFNSKTQKFKLAKIKSTPETKQLIKEMNKIYPTISLLI